MSNLRNQAANRYHEIQKAHADLTDKIELLNHKQDDLEEEISNELTPKHLIDRELILVEKPSTNYESFILESQKLTEQGYFPRYGYLTNNVNPRSVGKAAKVFRVCLSRIQVVDYDNTSDEVRGTYLVWKLYANPMKTDGSYGTSIISTHLFDKIS